MWNLKIPQNQTKQTQKKRSDLWLSEAESSRVGNWRKVVKKYELPVKRQISSRDVSYCMMTTANTAVMIHKKVVTRANSMSSHHNENFFPFSFSFYSVCMKRWVLVEPTAVMHFTVYVNQTAFFNELRLKLRQ